MSYHKSLPGAGWCSIVGTGANPDPLLLLEVESFEINTEEETADLENSDGVVIDTFPTKSKTSGSISLKAYSAELLAAVARGGSVAAGATVGYQQTATVPGSVAYTITVTHSATFVGDLGVINLSDGKPMTCDTVAADGVYSVAAGVYTFHSAQASKSVLITYRATTTTGATTTISTVSSATAASKFGLHCYQTGKAGKSWGFFVPAAVIPGITAKFSKAGWSDTTLKFTATADASNVLAYHYNGQVG